MKFELYALIGALAVTICGQVAYHTIARAVGATRQPWELIAAAYLFGMCLVVVVGVVGKQITFEGLISPANLVPALGLGMAVAMVEIGYIYSYRSGLSLSTGALGVLALTTVALVPIAILFFAEQLSARLVIGAVITLAGVWIMKS